MNTKSHMNSITAISGFALIGLLFATDVDAQVTETVAVEVTFVAVITVTADSPLQFGLIDVLMPLNDLIVIAPNDGLTDIGTNIVVLGQQFAADVTITATSGASINILIDGVSLPAGADYTLEAFRCEYDLIAEQDCGGAGMNVTAVATGALRVGMTLRGAGGATAGNQDGTFDVTVIYV